MDMAAEKMKSPQPPTPSRGRQRREAHTLQPCEDDPAVGGNDVDARGRWAEAISGQVAFARLLPDEEGLKLKLVLQNDSVNFLGSNLGLRARIALEREEDL